MCTSNNMSSINEFFIISFFKQILNHSFNQKNEHVEMNNFSCSLSCTWMTVIDYFMLLTAYLEMFHWRILLNC